MWLKMGKQIREQRLKVRNDGGNYVILKVCINIQYMYNKYNKQQA